MRTESGMVEVNMERLDEFRVSLDITVPAEEVDRTLRETLRKLAAGTKVKGFRAGRVPREVLLASVGRENLMEQALQELLPRAVRDAVRQTKVIPVESPRFDAPPSLEEGKPLTVKAVVEVLPELKLADYGEIAIEMDTEVEVTPGEVQEAIDDFLKSKARIVPAGDRVCGDGDLVSIAYVLREPGAGADAPPFERQEATVALGEKSVLPEIEKQVAGMKELEEKSFDVAYPDNYHNEKLAGRTMNATVTVKKIFSREIPELTDELVKEHDCRSVEDFRGMTEANLRAYKGYEKEQRIRTMIVDRLIGGSEIRIPSRLIERDLRNNQFALERILVDRGQTLDDYLRSRGLTYERWREEEKAASGRRVAFSLITDEIFHREGMEITDEEIKLELAKYAAAKRLSSHEMKKLMKNGEFLDRVNYTLKENKVLDLLRRNVKLTPASAQGTKPAGKESTEG
ncbi:MAG: trigger factor [bacterium]